MFLCSCCGYRTRFLKLLIRHYTEHASEPNFIINCGINNCLSAYKNVESFRKPVFKKHSAEKQSNPLHLQLLAEENELNSFPDNDITDEQELCHSEPRPSNIFQCSESGAIVLLAVMKVKKRIY